MKITLFLLLTAFLIVGCNKSQKVSEFELIEEKEIIPIELEGVLSTTDIETSSIAWFGDDLFFFPQFPHLFSDKYDGVVFKLSKDEIIRYLNSEKKNKLKPKEVYFSAPDLKEILRKKAGGIEAAIFFDNSIYLSVEFVREDSSFAYLLKGNYLKEENIIRIDKEKIAKINIPYNINNLTVETLTFVNDRIIAIPELNGKNIPRKTFAPSFDKELNFVENIKMDNIEFRVTDATYINPDSSFYVMNYNYPGEAKIIKPAKDEIAGKYGIGKLHSETDIVERIIKLKLTKDGIKISDDIPTYLKLNTSSGKNWEGIVQLDDLGFLIITDAIKEQIFAFVKNK